MDTYFLISIECIWRHPGAELLSCMKGIYLPFQETARFLSKCLYPLCVHIITDTCYCQLRYQAH